MNRQDLLLYVNVLLAIAALAVSITGIYKFLLVQGIASWWTKPINVIHDWGGILFVLFAVVHVILNFPWIVANLKRKFTKKV